MDNFEERAQRFFDDLKQNQGYRDVEVFGANCVRSLQVGTGNHEGLVFKLGNATHVARSEAFSQHMIQLGTTHFTVSPVQSYQTEGFFAGEVPFCQYNKPNGIIQPHLEGPTLRYLQIHLGLFPRIETSVYSRDPNIHSRCSPFLDENPRFTEATWKEISGELRYRAAKFRIGHRLDNYIMLGEDDQYKIAVIDA